MKKLFIILALIALSLPAAGQTGTVKFPTALDDSSSLLTATDRASTTLNGGIDASVTSITLTSASLFPTSGLITIDNEQITYTGKSTNTLTGCTRGVNGTSAASHSNGAAVRMNLSAAYHNLLRGAIIAAETKIGTGASTPAAGTVFQGNGSGTSTWAELVYTPAATFTVGGAALPKASNTMTLNFGNDAQKPGIRWYHTTQKMQFSNDGATWSDLGTGAGGGLSGLTAGKILKAASATTAADSILAETGGNTINVGGALTVNTSATIGGSLTANNGLTVSGAAVVNGTLTVNNPAAATEAVNLQTFEFGGTNESAAKYATLGAAVTAIGSNVRVVEVGTAFTVDSTVTVPATLKLRFTGNGYLNKSGSGTVTCAGPCIEAPLSRKIFNGFSTGNITFTGEYPETISAAWWGWVTDDSTDNYASIRSALDSMQAAQPDMVAGRGKRGGRIKLPPSGGTAYVSDKIEVNRPVHIEGGGVGGDFSTTNLRFGAGKTGFYIHRYNTGTTAAGSDGTNTTADNTIIENVSLKGTAKATTSTVDVWGLNAEIVGASNFPQGFDKGHVVGMGGFFYPVETSNTVAQFAGVMSAGSATLTCASCSFTAAMVGRAVNVAGAGANAGGVGVGLHTTIASYTNSTTVTLGASASTAVNPNQVQIAPSQITFHKPRIRAIATNGSPTVTNNASGVTWPTNAWAGQTVEIEGTNYTISSNTGSAITLTANFVSPHGETTVDGTFNVNGLAAQTTLNGGINNSVTTITLTAVTGLASSGTVRIDDEKITYTGISGNDLTGCTRGASGSAAASHSNGAAVYEYLASQTVTLMDAHGVDAKAPVVLKDVYVTNFSGNGVNFDTSFTPWGTSATNTNANNSLVQNVRASQNLGHGFFTQGQDSNIIRFIGADATSNRGAGYYENGFLGNNYQAHAATNWFAGNFMPAAATSSRSFFGGSYTEDYSTGDTLGQLALMMGGTQGGGRARDSVGGVFGADVGGGAKAFGRLSVLSHYKDFPNLKTAIGNPAFTSGLAVSMAWGASNHPAAGSITEPDLVTRLVYQMPSGLGTGWYQLSDNSSTGTSASYGFSNAAASQGGNQFALPNGVYVGGVAAANKITKHLTATASLNFGATSANTCDALTVTVTGAADGNTVELGVPNALAAADANQVFWAFVSAADTVTVKRCNLTGSPLSDPSAATVRVAVWQH